MLTKLKTLAFLAAFALAGCTDPNVPSPGANAPVDASPASAKARISKICMQQQEKYFAANTSQARCDCFGDAVGKKLNKDQLSYLANYNEIPFNSADEYDPIKNACLAGVTPPASDKPAAKKKKS